MHVRKNNFDHVLANMLPIIWRRRRALYVAVVAASCAAFLFYSAVGERYEVYTLLRVGQGIKDKATGTNSPFGEGVDLASRIDSLARIGTTDFVISQAMEIVGTQRLFNEEHMTLLGRAKQAAEQLILGEPEKPRDAQVNKAAAIAALRDKISARQEGRSDLLRISFRFPDPEVAADFLNALSNSLVGIQAGLVQLPGADEFYQDQARRLEQEAERAGAALKEFSVAASIYSASEQRALLLKRASELSTLIASTRGSIEDRKGQKQAIIDQLAIMRPVAQSKTVTGIIGRLGGADFKPGATSSTQQFEEAPPLLLIKVYQDAMATLLKVNSELNGALKLEASLQEELERVNDQLGDLTSREAEYDRLKRVLTRASSAADHYGVRMMEEQISQDSAKKTQLSSVRVVQLADKPIAPMLPRIGHLVVLALLGGLAAGAALALLLELALLRRQQEEIDEFVASKLAHLPGRNSVVAAE